MTQQGDNWWDKLYDESAPDTAPTTTGDTLDDRFDSASQATTELPAAALEVTTPAPATEFPAPPVPPSAPRTADGAPGPAALPPRAPWEPLDDPGATPEPRSFAAPGPREPAPTVPDAAPDPRKDPRAEPTPNPTPDAQPPAPPEANAVPAPVPVPRPRTAHIGNRPPTYEAEPTALPAARPGELGELVADTVLDGARYGSYTLRAASQRGDSARYRGEPRRDALLTARFGQEESALVLVAVASGARAAEAAHLAAADACRWIGEAVGRSHFRLSEDIRSGRRGDLKSGLHRLTDRTYGKLRARADELGVGTEEYTAGLRCLLLSADPACRTRVFFGIGAGGLFRLRDGAWQDIEPLLPEPAALAGAPVVGFGSPPAETAEGDRATMRLGVTGPPGSPTAEGPPPAPGWGDPGPGALAPPAEPFRFRASVARPGDTLLLASNGLAEPMRGEPALAKELAERWAAPEPPGLAAFLADTQLRVKGYADDRTGVAVWEA
ncbi:protein phosphatase 2C domain-containing protein [Streptomyces sp. NPDC056463]|uniref:protein phosphatase 2C domain-containing protein n=1 Tax=Streptomyces sp. NPDC056463 TaxID=3345827 RepID=UPI00368BD29F